jgi:rfaE bifunctional protein nucleotidyltransferase chain/domain
LGQVVSQADLILRRGPWKADGHVVVCVKGSFDLLHPGHIRLLEQARAFGDILVVAVRNDASVHASFASDKTAVLSSVARPITPASERMEILASLAAVDYVVEFDDQSWPDLCTRLAPDLMVRGAADEATTSTAPAAPAAGRLETVAREPGYSTEQVIARIAQTKPTP